MKISYSKLTSFMDCPYKHHLRYNEGLRRKTVGRPLSFGKDFHELLEHRGDDKKIQEILARVKDEYYGADSIAQESLGENYPTDLATIFEDYTNHWTSDTKPDITELEFLLPIGNYKGEEVTFHGFIDGYYKDTKTIEEHKTFSRKPDSFKLFMNTQTSLYAKAIQQLFGEYPKTILWDYIKSTPAQYPVWLEKSKRFSISKSENITVASYTRACKEHEVEPDGAAIYEGNTDNFFMRREVEIYPENVERVFSDFKDSIKVMLNSQKTGYKSKNIGQNCSWCDYRDICMAEFSGANILDIINRDFTKET